MSKKNFEIGLYYGMLKRRLRKVLGLRFWDYRKGGKRETYNKIKNDLRYANIDLLHYLNSAEFNSVGEFIIKINLWLELEAKANGYDPIKYMIGHGKNTFYQIELERELSSRERDKLFGQFREERVLVDKKAEPKKGDWVLVYNYNDDTYGFDVTEKIETDENNNLIFYGKNGTICPASDVNKIVVR